MGALTGPDRARLIKPLIESDADRRAHETLVMTAMLDLQIGNESGAWYRYTATGGGECVAFPLEVGEETAVKRYLTRYAEVEPEIDLGGVMTVRYESLPMGLTTGVLVTPMMHELLAHATEVISHGIADGIAVALNTPGDPNSGGTVVMTDRTQSYVRKVMTRVGRAHLCLVDTEARRGDRGPEGVPGPVGPTGPAGERGPSS